MSFHSVLLFAHILGVVVWIGGRVSLQVLGMCVRASSDPQRMAALATDAEWMGTPGPDVLKRAQSAPESRFRTPWPAERD